MPTDEEQSEQEVAESFMESLREETAGGGTAGAKSTGAVDAVEKRLEAAAGTVASGVETVNETVETAQETAVSGAERVVETVEDVTPVEDQPEQPARRASQDTQPTPDRRNRSTGAAPAPDSQPDPPPESESAPTLTDAQAQQRAGIRGAAEAVESDPSLDPVPTEAEAQQIRGIEGAAEAAARTPEPVPDNGERFGNFETRLPEPVEETLPGNAATGEAVLDDILEASGRVGADVGRTLGESAGGAVDVGITAATEPESIVDVERDGAGTSVDLDTAGATGTATRIGRAGGETLGRQAGQLVPGAVKAGDESLETAIAAGQEAPGLIDTRGNAVDADVGDLSRGEVSLSPGSAIDVADETEPVTDAITDRGSEMVAGLGAGALEFNEEAIVERSGEDLNLPGVGAGAEADLATAGATVVSGEREQPVISSDEERAPEAFGQIVGTAAAIGVEAGAGTVATRGLQFASRRGVSAARRQRADVTFDAEETVAPGDRELVFEQGEQPTFDTDTDAPTEQALAEFRERAAANPDEVSEAVQSEQVLFRSEEARLPEEFEAGQGNFELAGLFGSSDLAPLRADLGGGESVSRTEFRLPRLADFTPDDPGRFSALPAPDIEAIPDRAAGSGFARIDGETRPDPEAPGNRFLQNEAEPGTAFVRPTGDRTPELEAVFPPGTEFSRQGTGLVDLPDGDEAPVDIFRRPEDRVRQTAGGLGAAPRRQTVDLDAPERSRANQAQRDTLTPDRLGEQRRSGGPTRERGDPVTPAVPDADGVDSVRSDTASETAQPTPSGAFGIGGEQATRPATAPASGQTADGRDGGRSAGVGATPLFGASGFNAFGGFAPPTGPGGASGGASTGPGTRTGGPDGTSITPPGFTAPPSTTGSSPPTGGPVSAGGGGGGGSDSPGGGSGTGTGFPFGPTAPDSTRRRGRLERDGDDDRDDRLDASLQPAGQRFRNPIASAAGGLVGLAATASQATDGATEPPQDERAALDPFGFGGR